MISVVPDRAEPLRGDMRDGLTARSHDGGLDGVINEDTLGLDQVVVQAKRFNSAVDVKLIREFAGSLDEHGTDKGVFFTTDKFTGPATEYVKSIKKRKATASCSGLIRFSRTESCSPTGPARRVLFTTSSSVPGRLRSMSALATR